MSLVLSVGLLENFYKGTGVTGSGERFDWIDTRDNFSLDA
jgi:hypothetical protein